VSAQGEVPTIFLFLPAGAGESAKIIVEAVPDPVIEQSFAGAFEQRRAWGSQGFAVPVTVLGIKTGGPFVRFEEADDAAVALAAMSVISSVAVKMFFSRISSASSST